MDNVVYILGAGFSAPLGLPVISNFISMAKDLYEKDRKKYQHFGKVLDRIRKKLAYVAWIYNCDLDNIEDILSILVMEQLVGKSSQREINEYVKFILDVIQYYTPEIIISSFYEKYIRVSPGKIRCVLDREHEQDNFRPWTGNKLTNLYTEFVGNLFDGHFKTRGLDEPDKNNGYREFEIKWEYNQDSNEKYSVITFNYDLVLEKIAKNYSLASGGKFHFIRVRDRKIKGFPYFVKLHGSVDDDMIVPPTWNKSMAGDIDLEWKKAYQLLSSANHIRILGYSLPETDSYVRYLLKASTLRSVNLKSIDVICLDNNDDSLPQ